MHPHPDDDALLAAIVREPLEDTVRLAFADHCDETDRPERAQFIRAQIELHEKAVVWEVQDGALRAWAMPRKVGPYTAKFELGSVPRLSPRDYLRFQNEPHNCGREIGAVRHESSWTEIEFYTPVELPPNTIDAMRARDLWEAANVNYRMWYSNWFWSAIDEDSLKLNLQPMWIDDRVTRGFVGSFIGGLESMVGTNLWRLNETIRATFDKLFRSHPITAMELRDFKPDNVRRGPRGERAAAWWNGDSEDLRIRSNASEVPGYIFKHLKPKPLGNQKVRRYRTDELAVADLSFAVVNFGRECASLPLLVRSEE